MDTLTWLSLGLQLAALCSIVGALLLYLLRKGRGPEVAVGDSTKTVLVTSVETALGLQIATYLSGKGWRVIGGCKPGGLGARLVDSWVQTVAEHPNNVGKSPPRLATLLLDVTREDMLEEAAIATAQHLPAGEHGIWAVINTAGCSGRGGPSFWEGALRGNVLGALRVAKTFAPLVAAAANDHQCAGRIFYIGLTSDTSCDDISRSDKSDALFAGAAAARWGTWGAANALRTSLREHGLHVVLLHTPDLTTADIYAPPVLLSSITQATNCREESVGTDVTTSSECCKVIMPGEAAEYSAKILSTSALQVLEEALRTSKPKNSYQLRCKDNSWFFSRKSMPNITQASV